MKNILVALDFEDKSRKLIQQGAALANAFGAKLWLVHVAEPDPEFVGYDVGPQYIRDFRAQELREEHKMLQKMVLELKDEKVDADALLIQGYTNQILVDEAKKLEADLIIVGHHDRSFLFNALVGGTDISLLRKAGVPVLVVPI